MSKGRKKIITTIDPANSLSYVASLDDNYSIVVSNDGLIFIIENVKLNIAS